MKKIVCKKYFEDCKKENYSYCILTEEEYNILTFAQNFPNITGNKTCNHIKFNNICYEKANINRLSLWLYKLYTNNNFWIVISALLLLVTLIVIIFK